MVLPGLPVGNGDADAVLLTHSIAGKHLQVGPVLDHAELLKLVRRTYPYELRVRRTPRIPRRVHLKGYRAGIPTRVADVGDLTRGIV